MNGKLVRDKIPEIIARDVNNGKSVLVKILDDVDYENELERKLDEEVAEYHEDGTMDELVDIFEVVIALAKHAGVTYNDLYTKVLDKRRTRGSFDNRYFLVEEEPDGPVKSAELCSRCRYDMSNNLCCGRNDCLTCEMRDKPESPTHKNGMRGCYCLSINDGDPCKYYTPIKEDT